MRKRDQERILKKYRAMSNERLLEEYGDNLSVVTNSKTEIMIELDYDLADIKFNKQYEKECSDCLEIIENILKKERGIDPWGQGK